MEHSNSWCSYKIGIYVRESRDDNEENYETIETQRDLLIDFVKKNSFGEIYKVYIDDNVSGSGFERRGIQQLKEDIKFGRITMLILKDLSRLGRNNAKTLLFLDFLEEYTVRVITFDGRYDSERDNDTVGIDTWFNERYIKDISRKIRANLRFKIEKGEYIGHAPYGYIKSAEKKNSLCIDEDSAKVVKEIFSLYREGYGYLCIAQQLNSKGYNPPAVRYSNSDLKKWGAVAVQRILNNRVYTGDTVQGVSEKVSFKSKKIRRLPPDKWVITQNTHQPIISKQEFDETQKIKEEKKLGANQHKGEIHIFKGILYCGRCGSIMFARKRKDKPMGYICGNYVKNGSLVCSSHYIREEDIISVIHSELSELFNTSNIRNKLLVMLDKEFCPKTNQNTEFERLEQQISARQKQQEILYLDKLEGKISGQLFNRMNLYMESRINLLLHEIKRVKSIAHEKTNSEDLINMALESINNIGFTNEIMKNIIEKIIVYDSSDHHLDSNILQLQEQKLQTVKEKGAVDIFFKFNNA